MAAPQFMDLTCPVCGETVQATGQGSMDITWVNNVLETRLTYHAIADHICPQVTIPPPAP
jgi:C4-type Zn-finger protein